MGYCVSDRTRAPLTGDEIRSCWRAVAEAPAASGLFDALDPPAAAPIPQPRPQPRPRRRAKAPKPPVQEVRAAAWAEGPSGELVDAPHVEAGKRDASTRQRRRRFWGR